MGNLGLPNLITLSRLLTIPFISYFYFTGRTQWAFLALTYAGFSDLIDGGLARLMGQRTKLGAILDPAADKALMLVCFTTLAIMKQVPVWFAVLVVVRDVYIVVGVIILKYRHKRVYIRPTYVSKMTTFFQLSLLFAVFAFSYLETTSYSWTPSALSFFATGVRVGFYLAVAFTLASGIHYTLVGWALFRGKDHEGVL